MSNSSRQKEKYEQSGELSQDNCDGGTAARTRPLSFDEIMYRRKNKKLDENVKEGAIEAAGEIPGDSIVENVSDHYVSERGYKHNKDFSPGVEKHLSGEKLSSRMKEENTSIKVDNISKWKDRERRESESKLKVETKKDMSTKAKVEIDKQTRGRRKVGEQPSDDSENEFTRKHSRDLMGKDRHEEKSRGKLERESKRKYQNGDYEKNRETRDRNTTKKHDLGKGRDIGISERKERKESSKSRHEESMLKRRRSRSREREEDRHTRSISLSPRAHKRLSSHSLKDRSGRQHSDIERSRITSNGSNSHYRRHGPSTSGLGGYSPRKRRSEAAVRTPPPTNRSPEKKTAKWDLAPERTDGVFSSSAPSNFQSSKQAASSNLREVVSAVPVASITVKPAAVVSPIVLSTKQNISIDSVQLTQATQPMRRLCIENVPASVSEKAVMECLNNLLLSSGVNHIQGTQPCINCIIRREKGQALVEFLTPEDALTALSFDGISFSGSILKISRPKDFVEVATGELEKSVAAVDAISDIVKDSPYKIFIGGISKALSSEMFMEIASAFGHLKAYHFEDNDNHNKPCAFLEYVDQSVTLKACAGLNGMKLGGQVITAVQAVPNALSLENSENQPFYGIPEDAKPLLQKPTQVLKLKNLFNLEGLSSLSELEVEEILEDVRLECARFGIVKSVNLVKYSNSHIATSGTCEVNEILGSVGAGKNLVSDETNVKTETMEEVIDDHSRGIGIVEFPSNGKEVKEVDRVVDGNSINDDKPAGDLMEDEPCDPGQLDSNTAVEDLSWERISETFSHELLSTSKNESDSPESRVADNIHVKGISVENKLMAGDKLSSKEVNGQLQEAFADLDASLGIESDANKTSDIREQQVCNPGHIFEPGCVFVEYGRTEASCTAAHSLHGRLYDDRIVTVEYVALDLYRERFAK